MQSLILYRELYRLVKLLEFFHSLIPFKSHLNSTLQNEGRQVLALVDQRPYREVMQKPLKCWYN